MKTSEYWEKAALQRAIAVRDNSVPAIEEVFAMYDDALDDINAEIKRIEYNFRKRYGLDEKTAAYFLDEAQREDNLRQLIIALENAPDEAAREQILEYIHLDGLSKRAYASRVERYNAVKESIYARVKRLAAEETAAVKAILKKAYSQSYYGVIDDTAKGLDVGINFGILNDRAIEEAVGARWHGRTFSERIWKRTDEMADKAQEITVRYLMSGRSLDKAAAELSEEFQVQKFHATTLIHTETAHVQNKADFKAYEELGIEEYKYLATLDYVTCERCQPLDGKAFKLSEAKEGVNYPVMHPKCRCTTTVNMKYDSRRARNPLTGKNYLVDGDMNYEQWAASLTPEQKKAMATARKKDERKTADKAQHAQYRHVLGTKEVPRGFKAFQEMKYTEPDRWEQLKDMYREKIVDKSAGSGIIKSRGGTIMNINNIDFPIEQRNTGKGNPNAILHTDRPLNNRQKKLLESLPEYDSKIAVRKKDVNMKDLSALTAHTGDEFALFTKGQERLIIRGNQYKVNVDEKYAKKLAADKYRWSGHTHPGVSVAFSTPSQGDKDILACFPQKISAIYNSAGQYRTFENEE